jgi:O-antigen/teichoic acid export membrane protein
VTEPSPDLPATVATETEPVAAGPVPVQPRPRRSTLFLAGSLAGGNMVSMVLRLIGGFLLGRLVEPATLGLFNGIGLVLGYAPFLQLGVLNGLNRELPFFVGKGDRERVKELAAAAQAWAMMVGAVVFIALAGVAVWYLAAGEWWKAAGWATNAVLALLAFYNTLYMQNTYRTSMDFAKLALGGVIENATALALLTVVAVLNFYGLCLRAIIAGVVSATVLYLWRPIRVGPHWNLGHLKHLLFIGAPIFAVGQIYSYWTVINSTLVLKLAGTTGMGLYSMVLMAGATVELIPLAVVQVVYPRMAEQYGRRQSVHALTSIARKPIIASVLGLIPVIALAWWAVGPVMHLLIPKYVDAVPAMRWSLLLALVTCFQPLNSVFNVVRKQVWYGIAIVTGMAAYGLCLLLLVRDGVYLSAFPQAMLAGRAVYMLACYAFIWYLRGRETRDGAT